MKAILLTPWISPHQLPLAKSLATMFSDSHFRYHYLEPPPPNHVIWGWDKLGKTSWCQIGTLNDPILKESKILLSGLRMPDLFQQRAQSEKVSFYASERWFKPPIGFLRVFVPSYFKMVLRFLACLKSPKFMLLPMGIHAARDFARMIGFFKGDLRCLFRAPNVAFESKPGGVVVTLKDAITAGVLSKDEITFAKKYGFVQIPKTHWGKVAPKGFYTKMRIWGYFVAPPKKEEVFDKTNSSLPLCTSDRSEPKVLWVGRMLNWKRVDVLVRACRPRSDLKCVNVSLSLYGRGPQEMRLRKLCKNLTNIKFKDFVPVEAVRGLMRSHDVYVLSSNGYEGWGAVVSEALEEGMKVLGTVDGGSSATILPPTHLFKSGDVKRLTMLLRHKIEPLTIGPWTAAFAAEALLNLSEMQE